MDIEKLQEAAGYQTVGANARVWKRVVTALEASLPSLPIRQQIKVAIALDDMDRAANASEAREMALVTLPEGVAKRVLAMARAKTP